MNIAIIGSRNFSNYSFMKNSILNAENTPAAQATENHLPYLAPHWTPATGKLALRGTDMHPIRWTK
ncbi:hypothetical protein [uncultured Mailhella sp.]|uniref:hypothetical protein n=1 Tax=uncultured Mailhella sp. TaxID=1981031 RepID=UPI00262AB9DF|nr:hypothetical protein [uncultured Mailhella sp.]